MPPKDGNEVGSANFRLTADNADLNAKVDQAKAKVHELSQTTQDAGKTAQQAWDEMTGKAEKAGDAAENAGDKAADGMGKFEKGAAGVLAVLLLVSQALQEVKNYIDTVHFDGFDAAGEALNKIQNASAGSRVETIRKQLAELNNELEATQKHWANAPSDFGVPQMVGRSISAIKEQIKVLQQAQDAASAEVNKTRADRDNEFVEMQIQRNLDVAEKRAAAEIAADKKIREDRTESYRVIQEGMDAVIKQYEKEQRLIERNNRLRVQGVVNYQNALERLYAAQSAGFNGEGSNNSLQGSIDALEIAVRGAAARMGGI